MKFPGFISFVLHALFKRSCISRKVWKIPSPVTCNLMWVGDGKGQFLNVFALFFLFSQGHQEYQGHLNLSKLTEVWIKK